MYTNDKSKIISSPQNSPLADYCTRVAPKQNSKQDMHTLFKAYYFLLLEKLFLHILCWTECHIIIPVSLSSRGFAIKKYKYSTFSLWAISNLEDSKETVCSRENRVVSRISGFIVLDQLLKPAVWKRPICQDPAHIETRNIVKSQLIAFLSIGNTVCMLQPFIIYRINRAHVAERWRLFLGFFTARWTNSPDVSGSLMNFAKIKLNLHLSGCPNPAVRLLDGYRVQLCRFSYD